MNNEILNHSPAGVASLKRDAHDGTRNHNNYLESGTKGLRQLCSVLEFNHLE
jgi:hypothetical protein